MIRCSAFLVFISVLSLSSQLWAEPVDSDKTVSVNYNRDVQPILAAACFQCHGPDEENREADLRLDAKEGIESVFGGSSLDGSEAWSRITSDDESERMPPPDADHQLTKQETDTLARWIQQGAGWQSHWSFVAPHRPDSVQANDATHPIDQLLMKRIGLNGLTTTQPADRARWLRRVTFDLSGLPPTIAELDAFLADKSDDADEKVVDRLLASPRFGERMTVAWLDAARYGDTSVFHGDGPRDMWAWRDWVINAYNNNMPFDQFTVEQLAGDLIPEATVNQKIASGFNRNNATTDEGGAIAEEFRVEYAVDRVKTTSTVWLGLTMECAQCHDHKYDPISQEDYYRFYAYFNQAADAGMQTRNGNAVPTVDVPNYAKAAELATIRQELRRSQADLDARATTLQPEFERWVKVAQTSAEPIEAAPSDMVAHFPLDENKGNVVRDAIDSKRTGKAHGKPKWLDGKLNAAIRTDGSRFVDFGNVGDFERDSAFSYGCWVRPSNKNSGGAPLAKMNDGNNYRGYDLYLQGGQVGAHIISSWPDDALKVVSKKKIEKDKWSHVLITYDGSSKAAGIRVYINGQHSEHNVEKDHLKNSIRTKVPCYAGRRNPGSHYTGAIDDVRLFDRALSANEVALLANPELSIAPILAKATEERTEEEVARLKKHFLSTQDKVYQKLTTDHAELKRRESEASKPLGTVMVMNDVDKPRMTYVLSRGNYASPQKDRPVSPGVPAALPALPTDAPANRLGLARWMVSPQNPLTARVAVNRYWMMFFGQGLVESVEDFGSQGTWPSHPDLLDWLAVDFVESGWDIKRMVKQLVMSNAYRRSSRSSREMYEQDPSNRYLARGPRFRLQGEFIRDTALMTSGLMIGKIGGPSVKPYQPPGLWNEVSINTSLRFQQDHGDKLYRRSMYIYWKRSAPPPSMAIFDAPSREKCTIRRSRTNTPLQALVTLNDPQFVEAARAFAERVIKEAGDSTRDQIELAYRMTTSVHPTDEALDVLMQSYRTELAVFQAVPERAEQLLSVGESKRNENLDAAHHAALTIVISMILNLDETLTRG